MSTFEWLCLIGVLAGGFWAIHHDLQNFVRREDCREDMGGHCEWLGRLDKDLGEVKSRVAKIETKMEEMKK